jgi:hypothetical protein
MVDPLSVGPPVAAPEHRRADGPPEQWAIRIIAEGVE